MDKSDYFFILIEYITEKHPRKEGLMKRRMKFTGPNGKAQTVDNSIDDFQFSGKDTCG